MSCCGNRRAMMHGAVPPRAAGASTGPQTRNAALPAVTFEYQGETGVSAIGGVTRTLYRFAGKRAQVAVDARDAASMSALPGLKRVG